MPRKKLEMKLIEDPKKRKATLKNRRDGLVQKTWQLATLCGVDALCICYDPTPTAAGAAVATTWPPDREDVLKLIAKYRDMPADRVRQVLNARTFNEEELKKEQHRLLKVRQCGAGDLGPWDSSFDGASVGDLSSLLGALDETERKVQQRMAALGCHAGRDDVIVPAAVAFDDAAVAEHAMSLPDNVFNFGGCSGLPNTGGSSMVTQYYNNLSHDQMLAQPFLPLQPPCHGYQMPPPFLGYQMPPPFLGYQMPPSYITYHYHHQMSPPPTLLGPPEFGATGYATNVVHGTSATGSEFFDDDLMQGFDDGGAYVNNDVLVQAFAAAGNAGAGYHLTHHVTARVWPLNKANNPIDGAAFQLKKNGFARPPAGSSASCSSTTTFQGGFQN